ncbi:MAG: hypothetical protein J1F07_06090 [Muribaculaceae bacterium]|nr:hypothetical protein [Muribaculaceae bacterium]
MDFVFESRNIIKRVKRTLTNVCIAGISIGIAVIAAQNTPDISSMSIPIPLEKTIACAPISNRLPQKGISLFEGYGERTYLLESSLKQHGMKNMDEKALSLWKEILPDMIEIPFSKVFAQYDKVSESFFFTYNFKSGQRLEATTYVDSEDNNVYFSIVSEDKVFFQNILPRKVFFEKAKSTWEQFEENNV